MQTRGTGHRLRGHVRRVAAFAFCAAVLSSPAQARSAAQVDEAETRAVQIEPVRIAGPFEFPWSIAFLPDRSLLLTERTGRLQRVTPDGLVRDVTGLPPIFTGGLAGLLDVAVDPDFASNRLIYVSYVHGDRTRSSLRVMRARLSRDLRRLEARTTLFDSSAAARDEQYGGRLAVTPDGYLFLTVGDRWEQDRAQHLDNHLGKVIRIRTDGSVPPDNPFAGRKDARPEIWSLGHRNAQGLAFDEARGDLYAVEHGPQGGDELNLIRPGRNYGWPVIGHGIGYDGTPMPGGTAQEGMEQPEHVFGEPPAQAPSGLAIDSAGAVPILWVGALAGEALLRLEHDGEGWRETRLLHEEIGRIRDVRIGPDGLLYVITDAAEGFLYRLDPVVEQAGQPRPAP
ncbi:PQQ-dependent sugar dehydrogenase [Pseudorhodoplanes sp.]|uniref:PQQ-dependent sugar dehydrogenase n=1 Tax=Pseudorhodoplanes sp. TaxID=1934341 RepID=UPI00391AB5FB